MSITGDYQYALFSGDGQETVVSTVSSRTRPGHVMHVSTESLGVDPSHFDAISVTADSGGSGEREGKLVDGVKLSTWNGFKWVHISCNAASPTEPATLSWTTRDPDWIEAMHSMQGFHFALTPRGENQKEFARLTTDYFEVEVRYHLDGEGVIPAQPGTGGTPSAVCP